MMSSTTDTTAAGEERTTEPQQRVEQELEQQRQYKRKRPENDCDGPDELAGEESAGTKKDSSSSSSSAAAAAAAADDDDDSYHDTVDIATSNSIRNEYQGFSFQHQQHQHRFPTKGESSVQKCSADDNCRSDDEQNERAVVDCIKVDLRSSSTTTTTTTTNSMTAKDFFDKYIATRKPCIIKGYDKISITTNDLSRVAGNKVCGFALLQNFGSF